MWHAHHVVVVVVIVSGHDVMYAMWIAAVAPQATVMQHALKRNPNHDRCRGVIVVVIVVHDMVVVIVVHDMDRGSRCMDKAMRGSE